MRKKILAVMLALCMVVTMIPVFALAENEGDPSADSSLDRLTAAIDAAAQGATVALAEDVTVDVDTVLAKGITIDLAGHTLTILEGNKITVNEGDSLTVSNSETAGGLVIAGKVAVDGDLDVSSLPYGEGGLIASQGGKLVIGDAGYVKLVNAWAGADPNVFVVFADTEIGAKLGLGDKDYSWNGSKWMTVVSIGNNGYPYGKDMNKSSVTLVIEAENASSY